MKRPKRKPLWPKERRKLPACEECGRRHFPKCRPVLKIGGLRVKL